MRDLLISLRTVEKRYEGKLFGVGELHISGMVKDCADAIEKLLAENAQLRQVVSAAKAYQQAVEAKPDDYDEEEFLRAAGVLEKALGEYQELQEVR